MFHKRCALDAAGTYLTGVSRSGLMYQGPHLAHEVNYTYHQLPILAVNPQE